MIRLIILFLFVTFSSIAQSLNRLPLSGDVLETQESALFKLKSLLTDGRYKTCREDLHAFLETLTPMDEKELKKQETEFNDQTLLKLMDSKRKQMKDVKSSPVTVNKRMGSTHFLITHKDLKCEISIYPSLGQDSIKSNVDRLAGDLTISAGANQKFTIAPHLLGASADPTRGATIQFDPSKVDTFFTHTLPDQKARIKLIEAFQQWQERSGANPDESAKPPPR
ncbi:MAG: hypothetical protein JNL11_08665 [Bdellovibrionaceae bacterium]|nr:hypothetical protein [Pseudobdellovibrionaceae bacterium]